MSFTSNLILITMLVAILIFYLYFIFRRTEEEQELTEQPYDLSYLTECVKESFNDILNVNLSEIHMKKDLFVKREKLREGLKKALRTCSYGNIGEKEYVKDYIKSLLLKKCHISHENIDFVIPFTEEEKLTVCDKFDILLYLYKREYGVMAMEQMIEQYHLADGKKTEDGIIYEITSDEIEEIYDEEDHELSYADKLDILAQKIYQAYKGHGVIDELRDMRIDGLSAGVSGMSDCPYNYLEEIMKDAPDSLSSNYESIWMFYHGKNIHLSFLGFESKKELERVCKNIYRYRHPGQLSASNGYKVNELYDGARIVVVRPPLTESWAFFLRKFDTAMTADVNELITQAGSELVIEWMRWLIKGCQVIGITGEQGCGKTTLLKALIRFIEPSYTLRIQELVFETHLRRIYPKRNIITFQETSNVSGQESLDLQKKTDGVVNILGEVASAPVAAWVVQLSQVGTKMTMFTNHAMTTQKLIDYFRNALLSLNLFHDEKIAEEQVTQAINIDIHMGKDRSGHRYIERITEIIPLSPEYNGEEYDWKTGIKKYFDFMTKRHSYELRDLLVMENGRYVMKGMLSEEKVNHIIQNLTLEEETEFRTFINQMKAKVVEINEKNQEEQSEKVSVVF